MPAAGVPWLGRGARRSAIRRSLGFAQRCRPEVGVPQAVPAIQCRSAIRDLAALRAAVPTGGRRSPSRPRDSTRSAIRGLAALRAAVPTRGRRSPSRPRDSARSAIRDLAALRAAVPTGGRRSPSRPRDSTRSAIRGLAALRAAVPTGGRRSPSRPRDSMQIGYTRSRGPAGRGADRRSAFPKPSPRFTRGGVLPSAQKQWQRTSSAARVHEVQCPGWCKSRPHATMQRDAQARERRPLVGTARRRRAAGRTPTSGVVRLSAGTPPISIIRTDAFRCAARSGADRRSAFQAVPAILPGRLYAISLRFAQRCRPPPGELAGGRRSYRFLIARLGDHHCFAVANPPGAPWRSECRRAPCLDLCPDGWPGWKPRQRVSTPPVTSYSGPQ